jgi:hypothetical protein
MYYTGEKTYESLIAKELVENWYQKNFETKSHSIATSTYCEAAKVKFIDRAVEGTLYSAYTPNYTCETDVNEHGLLTNLNISNKIKY